MKKEAKILKADHDPVKVGDNVLIDVKTKPRKHKTPTPETDNPSSNQPPETDNASSSTSNQPPLRSVVTSLQQTVEKLAEEMRVGFQAINTRLNKQDEFNQGVTNYMKSHP
ncbi:MAG: hypothetical protein LBD63_02760 [Mycoplasmataceae bacterium]|jgi:hypothetical protein|nr:hypothetical protein [Mycoplasmataceae bacterium]